MTAPIFLTGARGCGKTTIGRLLAGALDREFIDTDQRLQQQRGQTIAQIVEQQGWQKFREYEAQVLREEARRPCVVATGGGIILAPENRQLMRQRGVVVYLQVPVGLLEQRLQAEPEPGQRPTLTGQPLHQEIAHVLSEREPLYLQTAHFTVDAAAEPQAVVVQILACLRAA